MAISENTHGSEQRRLEELCQSMQNSWIEFQQSIKARMMKRQEKQERTNSTLNELITSLSRQVLQIASAAESRGNNFKIGNFTFPRLSKIDFPHFDGDDVHGWVYKCEQFCKVDNTMDNTKVKMASIHLGGKALLWH